MNRSTGRGYALMAACALVGAIANAPGMAPARISAATTTSIQDEGRRGEPFQWHGAIAAGQTVEVRGVNGPIHVESSANGEVQVSAVKSARHSDPNSVRVVVVPHAQGVTICAVYPDVDGERNECKPGGGHMNTRDNDVKVEFDVKVPAGAPLTASTVNGAVDVKELDARASVQTVNGSIDLQTGGFGTAQTVNGSITARLGQATWEDTLALKTVNGSIELSLPPGTDADLVAKTVNGRIESELPITMHEMSRRSIRGTIGSGGRALSLETVNGSISLKTGG
jgi:Toastrack DUF4097